jgi:hypothetical protein
MNTNLQNIFSKFLWVMTILILAAVTAQALSGNWITYFFILPGGPSDLSPAFIQAMANLAVFHKMLGFIIGGFSILVLASAFIHKSSFPVRIFAVLGLMASISAAIGGYLFVHSGFQDRWSLGQMADSFVGVYAAYFIQLFFMNKNGGFPFKRMPRTSNTP